MKDILFFGGSTGLILHEIFHKIFFNNNHDDYNLINFSQTAAGNFYMAGAFFEYLNKHPKPDYVFFKFTGLNRWDLPFDKKVKLEGYEYQTHPGVVPADHLNKDTAKSRLLSLATKSDKNWVFSGGHAEAWLKNSVLQRIFVNIYDPEDENSTIMQSWQQVFTCLSLCETMEIPYNWTFYYDVTNPPSKYSKMDGHAIQLPKCIPTKQMLDFAPLNYAYDINDPPEDGSHYTRSVEEKYFKEEIIYNKIKYTLDKSKALKHEN